MLRHSFPLFKSSPFKKKLPTRASPPGFSLSGRTFVAVVPDKWKRAAAAAASASGDKKSTRSRNGNNEHSPEFAMPELSNPMLRRLATPQTQRARRFEAMMAKHETTRSNHNIPATATATTTTIHNNSATASQQPPSRSYQHRANDRADRMRREKRLREARRQAKADPTLHPCPVQLGSCPDPASCPFLHVPAQQCINVLRFGRCRGAVEGTCPFEHTDMAQQRSLGAGEASADDHDVEKHNMSDYDDNEGIVLRIVQQLVLVDSAASCVFSFKHMMKRIYLPHNPDPQPSMIAHHNNPTAVDDEQQGAAAFTDFARTLKAEAAALSRASPRGVGDDSNDSDASRQKRIAAAVAANPLLFVRNSSGDPDLVRVDSTTWDALVRSAQAGEVFKSDADVVGAVFRHCTSSSPHKQLAALSWAQAALDRRSPAAGSGSVERRKFCVEQLARWWCASSSSSSSSGFVQSASQAMQHLARRAILVDAILTQKQHRSASSPALVVQRLLDAAPLCSEVIGSIMQQRLGRPAPQSALLHWQSCFANFIAACLYGRLTATNGGFLLENVVLNRALRCGEWSPLLSALDADSTFATSACGLDVLSDSAAFSVQQQQQQQQLQPQHIRSAVDLVMSFLSGLRGKCGDGVPVISSCALSLLMLLFFKEDGVGYAASSSASSSSRLSRLAFRVVVVSSPTTEVTFERNTTSVAAALLLLSRAPAQQTFTQQTVLQILAGRFLDVYAMDGCRYVDPYFHTGSSSSLPLQSSSSSSSKIIILPSPLLFSLLTRETGTKVAVAIRNAWCFGATTEQRSRIDSKNNSDSRNDSNNHNSKTAAVTIGAAVLEYLQRTVTKVGDEPRFISSTRSQAMLFARASYLLGCWCTVPPCVSVALRLLDVNNSSTLDIDRCNATSASSSAARVFDIASRALTVDTPSPPDGIVHGVPLCLLSTSIENVVSFVSMNIMRWMLMAMKRDDAASSPAASASDIVAHLIESFARDTLLRIGGDASHHHAAEIYAAYLGAALSVSSHASDDVDAIVEILSSSSGRRNNRADEVESRCSHPVRIFLASVKRQPLPVQLTAALCADPTLLVWLVCGARTSSSSTADPDLGRREQQRVLDVMLPALRDLFAERISADGLLLNSESTLTAQEIKERYLEEKCSGHEDPGIAGVLQQMFRRN